jgi:hypothetical protein
VGGKIPGTINGKAAVLSYQGMLFSSDMPLESGDFARGTGFVTGSETALGAVEIRHK